MTERRYGPVKGAGTTITEKEGSRQIQQGALGFCGMAGIFEKGPVGELVIIKTAKEFNKQMGSYYDGTIAPDNAKDFYELARGAGGLALCRVTDGNEVQALKTLYTRNGDLRESMGVIKAANGGKWGGKALKFKGDFPTDAATDVTATTLDTGDESSFATDQLKGGYVELVDVANTQYEIASNTASAVGSSCVITVLDGSDMLTDIGAGADGAFYIVLDNAGKEITISVADGEDNPTTEFSVEVFVDGASARKFPNLNTDPDSANYWVSAINDDERNFYIEAVDGWAGKAHTTAARPADHYGKVTTVTETVLTPELADFNILAGVGALVSPTTILGTTTDEMVEQTFTCTFSSETAFTVASDIFGVVGAAEAIGTPTTPLNKFCPPFTLDMSVTAPDATTVVIVHYKPFVASELVGGFVYPDKVNASSTRFRITANTHSTVSIASGYYMTDVSEADDYFQIIAPLPLDGGRDGIADLVDADFVLQAWDIDNSPFNKVEGQGLGLLKYATPGWDAISGITSAVDIAGKEYADAKNHMYRTEIPKAIVDEDEAIAHINDTIGRSDFLVSSFPSWGYVMDPEAPGTNKLKEVSFTGMIFGRESRIAEDVKGYHKAAAGEDAILPKIKKLSTGTTQLDHEKLNPAGLSMIVLKKGNFVIWGDRTCYTDPNWKFKHQRELMSYYEHVLQEGYDWIIFAINDPDTDAVALLTLREFFRPEWRKRAIRGDSFADAAIFKLDAENNTDATRGDGDLNVEIQLRLADTVERFNILIGKQGIFDSVG